MQRLTLIVQIQYVLDEVFDLFLEGRLALVFLQFVEQLRECLQDHVVVVLVQFLEHDPQPLERVLETVEQVVEHELVLVHPLAISHQYLLEVPVALFLRSVVAAVLHDVEQHEHHLQPPDQRVHLETQLLLEPLPIVRVLQQLVQAQVQGILLRLQVLLEVLEGVLVRQGLHYQLDQGLSNAILCEHLLNRHIISYLAHLSV